MCANKFGYKALDLRMFMPGAIVGVEGGFHMSADPFRARLAFLKGSYSAVGELEGQNERSALAREVGGEEFRRDF